MLDTNRNDSYSGDNEMNKFLDMEYRNKPNIENKFDPFINDHTISETNSESFMKELSINLKNFIEKFNFLKN
ncbi:MAG: hypothetical protein SFU91_11705 [Chloroherpetonaceae bacterium]|nr:hypothetical protein [Chloroherpetonaceae bacterium]